MNFALVITTFLVAGCNHVQQPSEQPTPPAKLGVVTARPASESAGVNPISPDPDLPPNVPATARTLEPFRQLKLGMTRREVMTKVGLPDKDIGSGIHVDIYSLADGSAVTLGSGGNLIYARHQRQKGEVYDLLKSSDTAN